ncbi:ADP-ribosylation factor-like protein 2-binding protein [Stomoxys calcitrans]|uniref:ADP-ribosylation factor-like protein 2-binding protein n=1 Tax=Stomoxys calcitrans TaxID=35570 RepID=A0A1I8P3M5_STOCA|nr:ADP-ribosylation factor-like protein 2-binding protein [Stomoxys calcitrans]
MEDSANEDIQIDIVGITTGSAFFDEAIGHIEDIILSEEFHKMQNEFLEKHWSCFERSEENKLEYMDIFQEYGNKFERFIMQELRERMNDFDMERFAEELSSYNTKDDPYDFAASEIFELLQSFSDFQTFKELMLDYRNEKEGEMKQIDFDILITPLR